MSQPNFDPLPGNAVAHDVLEHFPGGDESPAHEFMALGAALLIRGTTGYFQRNGNINPPHVHIAGDFPDILRHIVDEGMGLPDPGKTKPIEDYDYMITDTIAEAIREVKYEYKDSPEDIAAWLPLIPLATGWMRKGWRKAQKRYAKCGIYFATECFEYIQIEADKVLNNAELGTIIEVQLELSKDSVSLREREPIYDD